MRIARVVGHVVSTVKDERQRHFKLLVVQPVDAQAHPKDDSLVAIDCAQAGVGDYVLVVQEGKSARQVMEVPDAPCEAIVVGVIDHLLCGGEQRVLRPPRVEEP
ncbi:MAG: EutN/CcmL family microcompartment protein [Deltaproteobacteria bacterium]|nr:EutN/CcmL family microcompartment protein [Deltaproteobacteria bacterium]